MDLLLLIGGKIDKIISNNNLTKTNTKIIKIDEKDLSKFIKLKKIINNNNYNNVYFACIDIEHQRFKTFIMLIFYFSNTMSGAIIDEEGKQELYSKRYLIYRVLPKLILEIFISSILIIYYHIKLPILKWIILKK